MIGEQWYACNSARKYPIDDAASAVDDAGLRLPDGLIVDVSLSVPLPWGTRIGIVGVSVQPTGVSVVFGVVADPRTPGNVAVQLVGSAAIYGTAKKSFVTASIVPLMAGVGGSVVFGPRASSGVPGSWAFSNSNAALLPRCVRLPQRNDTSIKVAYGSSSPVGAVSLVAGPDISITKESRILPNSVVPQPAVVVRLAQAAVGRNVFDAYKGPCGGRPESNTCDRPPIETINAITPDCNGVIRLNFEWPLRARPFAGGGGFVVDYGYGLKEVCGAPNLPTKDGVLPTTYEDGCPPLGSIDPDSNAIPPPPIRPDPVSIGSAGYNSGLPVCVNFDAAQWESVAGNYTTQSVVAPPPLSSCTPDLAFGLQNMDPSVLGVWLFNDSGYLPNTAKVVETNLRIVSNVARAGGGLILNYRQSEQQPESGNAWDDFFIFEIVCDLGVAQLRQWSGGVPTVLDTTLPIVFKPGSWYGLRATITQVGFDVQIHGEVLSVSAGPTFDVLGTVDFITSKYYPATGLFGVGSDRASALFGHFSISEA